MVVVDCADWAAGLLSLSFPLLSCFVLFSLASALSHSSHTHEQADKSPEKKERLGGKERNQLQSDGRKHTNNNYNEGGEEEGDCRGREKRIGSCKEP